MSANVDIQQEQKVTDHDRGLTSLDWTKCI